MKKITIEGKEYNVNDEVFAKIVEIIKKDPRTEELKEVDYMDFMFPGRNNN